MMGQSRRKVLKAGAALAAAASLPSARARAQIRPGEDRHEHAADRLARRRRPGGAARAAHVGRRRERSAADCSAARSS